MNRDTVIDLAKQAKVFFDDRKVNYCFYPNQLLEFASLVAAHEREECAKAIDDSSNICAPGPVQTVLREQARCIRSRE